MIDLGFTGNPFAWSNHRHGSPLIKEHLDRAIASNQWVHMFPHNSLLHLPASSSNHNPIILNSSNSLPFLPRPFTFEEFWTKDPYCGVVSKTQNHQKSNQTVELPSL